ncbi:hypothetical protein [Pelagibacterium lacus]|uniref:Yip1 domain-containing protein n=1 Tax=Pelagibacterium lacus TaxID=2282655 RepID=A0A369W662_9HYPH|nr:hypothetical protein [Pelagibacterium lacus]RDE10038.1 hypothetical protein DVH29_03660 [Pelagibacterium lacus]
MTTAQPTLMEETRAAIVGSWRLILGRRDAPGYFFTDLRGLASSFVALLVSVVVTFAMSAIIAPGGTGGSTFAALIQNALLYGGIMGSSWVVLRLTGLSDRFVAFVTVENWVNAIVSLILAVVAMVTLSAELILLLAVVIGFLARINNARLVVGMKAGQIVMLIVVQTIGMLIALLAVGVLFAPVAPTEI